MSARVPTFPEAKSGFVQELLLAFKSRSKSIKHAFSDWRITLALDEGEERVDLDFVDRHWRQIRLTAWQSGDMWFRSCKARPKRLAGWEFIFAFHLVENDQPASKVVETFERSRHQDDRGAIMAFWKDFDPKIDQEIG